jgi:tRNA1(Val) A37 N6-methylase TrmN6
MRGGETAVTEDTLYGGRVRLRQPARGHRAGTDAVLLAAAVDPPPGQVVCDVGAGVGSVGLMIGARSQARIIFVERDPVAAELCRQNAARNGLEGRAEVIAADILASSWPRRAGGLMSEPAHVVVTNPPFLDAARSRPSPLPARAVAHQQSGEDLDKWLRACGALVRPKGLLALVHRADRLHACLRHLPPGFGAIAIRPVHAQAERPAVRILVTAVKGSRAPLTILRPLILNDGEGRFTDEAAAIHRGERLLT